MWAKGGGVGVLGGPGGGERVAAEEAGRVVGSLQRGRPAGGLRRTRQPVLPGEAHGDCHVVGSSVRSSVSMPRTLAR